MRNISKIIHFGPLFALFMILLVMYTTIYCSLSWLNLENIFSLVQLLWYLFIAFLAIYNFLGSIYVEPGFVPFRWHPAKKNEEEFLQFCQICKGYKAPRSHHCRKCNRCVFKMDHHCPWINNCVGHFNHGCFSKFLFFSIIGAIHSAVLLIVTMFEFLKLGSYRMYGSQYLTTLSFTSVVFCLVSIGISCGVCLALMLLLYVQLKAILKNQTGIEEWIVAKAEERRTIDPTLDSFVYPYDLGRWENFKQVITFSLRPSGDGIHWTVKKGCSQFDLTMEQIEQKKLKKMRSMPHKVIKKYSGSYCPISNGISTYFHPLLMIERRMPVNKDDVIIVTRVNGHWMFGENENVDKNIKDKGWFPKSCVIPITDCSSSSSNDKKYA